MTPSAPAEARYTAARYFALVDEGVICADDRVELLEGVIVAMSPQNPPHASAVRRVSEALRAVVGSRAFVSVQLPLIAGPLSVPEPDVAVVPGRLSDYDTVHPSAALLVVEVADTSLLEDRLTKAAIYASAGIPDYWIVNLRDDVIEVFRAPEPAASRYREYQRIGRDGWVDARVFEGASLAVDDLLPGR